METDFCGKSMFAFAQIWAFFWGILLLVARYAQSTQNSKFVISLQYLKNEGRDEFDILHADKQTFLQVDVVNLDKFFVISLWYLKKEVGDGDEFLCRWEKFYTNWCYHFWWAWPGVPKVLKITSMRYLCNISRKNWVMKLMFCMVINMKVFWIGQACPKYLGKFAMSL